MTRGRAVARVAAKLGLDTTAGSEELILMQEWWNEGIVDVLLKTHCYVEIGDLTLQAGVTDYRTDHSILALANSKITSQNQQFLFDVVTLGEAIEDNAFAATTGSTVASAAIEGDLLMVSPAPTTADVIRYYYIPKPSQAAADGTTTGDATDPSLSTYGGIPTEYHLAIEYYMLWQAAEYDDKEHALSPKDYRDIYDGLCKDYRKRHRQKAGRGLRPARVGYPNSMRAGRRNDQYPER